MKKITKKSAKAKAWKTFSTYIRTKACLGTNKNQWGECYTCGDLTHYDALQTGHFISGRSGSVLFNEDVVRPQCMRCNVFLHGNLVEFTLRMINEVGKKKVEKLLALKHETKQYKTQDYLDIAEKYKAKLENL